MAFIVTFEHAVARAIARLKSLATTELPKVQSAVAFAAKSIPTVEAVASALDPAASVAITAIGEASNTVLARVAVALNDEATLQKALSSGTVTIQMATDEIADIKSVTPTILGVVQAIGLAHTIPTAAPAAATKAA